MENYISAVPVDIDDFIEEVHGLGLKLIRWSGDDNAEVRSRDDVMLGPLHRYRITDGTNSIHVLIDSDYTVIYLQRYGANYVDWPDELGFVSEHNPEYQEIEDSYMTDEELEDLYGDEEDEDEDMNENIITSFSNFKKNKDKDKDDTI